MFLPVASHRAHLGPAGDSRAELDAVIGRLVRVLEHLDAAHRGQRDPQIAVDRSDLLRRGQVQHQFAALYPQHRHPRPPAAPNVKPLDLLPAGRETETVPFSLPTEARSAAQLVDYLADPHRYFLAYQQLIRLGAEAARPGAGGPAAREPTRPDAVLPSARPRHGSRKHPRADDRTGRSRRGGQGAGATRAGLRPVQGRQLPTTHREAAEALLASGSGDPSPTVRKRAAWYAPGGTIYRRKAGYPVSQ